MQDTIMHEAVRPFDVLSATIDRATDGLLAAQRDDGHFVYELEADATIPSEYILLRHYLGEAVDETIEHKIGNYLRRIQSAEHDGWPLFHGGPFDVSATVKAYFALKMIGDSVDAPHMVRASAAILAAGGAETVNVFTKIQLALFEAGSWSVVPTLPVELILLPRWFPVHLDKMSYWARTVIVPLLVLAAKQPKARNVRRVRVDELYSGKRAKLGTQADNAKAAWRMFFSGVDWVLKRAEPLWPKRLRQHAIDTCVSFVTERLNGESGLGAIYPAMANSVMMFDCLGYPPEHPDRALARLSVEKLLVIKADEAYCQPCVSPVWDTALAAHCLLEVGTEETEAAAKRGLEWLTPLQELEVMGDWAAARPGVRPGGWAFQYTNPHYPDLDDTAVVVMAMARARDAQSADNDEAISRAVEWTNGMQSNNGGWGAFDADNTHHYLNNIPFADHGALLDPPTVDVSARCISMLAQLGTPNTEPRLAAALDYLRREQMRDGSWFGRWGVNYIYGTWSALCALNAAGFDGDDPAVKRGADWLVAIQNEDGGWGEDCRSYALDYAGHRPAPSVASQTAWALLGLMAAGRCDSDAVLRGIDWLCVHQDNDGLWSEELYTGGGFPRVFYLHYHGYAKYFPLWALARYRNLRRANDRRVSWGM